MQGTVFIMSRSISNERTIGVIGSIRVQEATNTHLKHKQRTLKASTVTYSLQHIYNNISQFVEPGQNEVKKK